MSLRTRNLTTKLPFYVFFIVLHIKNQKFFDFRGSVQKFMMTPKKLRNKKTSSNRNQYEEFRANMPKTAWARALTDFFKN